MNAPAISETPLLLRDLWYFALPSASVRPGALERRIIMGEPVAFARASDGRVSAIRDICPHRGVPLSAGKMKGDEVECPYHGWRFGMDGACTAIPSLIDGQQVDRSRIRVASYPVSEANGMIWIFMAREEARNEPPPPPPVLPLAADARPRLIEAQRFPCAVDHAVIGLMDPAHGPFVHNSWWWRGKTKPYAKEKKFVPSELGFTMVPHAPSSNSLLYKILGGGLQTEISFRLPGLRVEHIKAGTRGEVVGVTTVTPLSETETEVTQTFFWTLPWLSLLKPILTPIAKTFLGQDRDMVVLQQEGLRFNPNLMLIRDADVLAMWYQRLKKEWADAAREGRPFANPVPASTLRWKS